MGKCIQGVWMGSKNGGERAGRKGGRAERGLLAGAGAGYTCDKGKYEGL